MKISIFRGFEKILASGLLIFLSEQVVSAQSVYYGLTGDAIELQSVQADTSYGGSEKKFLLPNGQPILIKTRVMIQPKNPLFLLEDIQDVLQRHQSILDEKIGSIWVLKAPSVDHMFSLINELKRRDMFAWAEPEMVKIPEAIQRVPISGMSALEAPALEIPTLEIPTLEIPTSEPSISKASVDDFLQEKYSENRQSYVKNRDGAFEDPLYSGQYQMQYNGQDVNGVRGFKHLNTDLEAAWEITKGSPSIGIAIEDSAILDHPDLPPLNRFAEDETSLTDLYSTHGMNVAGITSAQHNSIGVKGVAPDSPLYVLGEIQSNITRVKAYEWMIESGVGVVNNSWSGGSCDSYAPSVHQSILDFYYRARNGKGGLVVFSAGNNAINQSCSEGPASNLHATISVGAANLLGQKTSYANYDRFIDIVALSSEEVESYSHFVSTLDYAGEQGKNAGDYELGFGGTSASAPLVAGVINLIMSANPDLNASEVRDILLSTAIDLEAPGYDFRTGHGLVNAGAAVRAALAKKGAPSIVVDIPQYVFNNPNGRFSATASIVNADDRDVVFEWHFDNEVATGEALSRPLKVHREQIYTVKAFSDDKLIAEYSGYISVRGDESGPFIAFRRSPYLEGIAPFDLSFDIYIPLLQREPIIAEEYSWDTGDGTQGIGLEFSHVYQEAGKYHAEYTFSQNNMSDTHPVTVHVYDNETFVPPTPVIDFDVNKDNKLSVSFGAERSIPGTTGYITQYHWDFGGGNTSELPFPYFTFDSEASYDVSLTTTDSVGRWNTVTKTVSVGATEVTPSNNNDIDETIDDDIDDDLIMGGGSFGMMSVILLLMLAFKQSLKGYAFRHSLLKPQRH